jgi:enolase
MISILTATSGYTGAAPLAQRSAVAHGARRVVHTQMATIDSIKARQIFDSRGNPTVEVDIMSGGQLHRASVPSGASTGAYEAVELRDQGERYMGKGVLGAVSNVNDKIAPKILGMDPTDQTAIDNLMNEMDGTSNKATLGANAILGVSLAAAKAGAAAKGVPLYRHFADLAGNKELIMPVPCFNVINGGSHAGNKLAFQEYFVVPTGAKSFSEGMIMGTEVYHNLAKILKKKFGGDATLIGDEGGFAPPCDCRSGLELVVEAIKAAGYEGKCTVGLDVAASEFKVKESGSGADAVYDLGMWEAAADKEDSQKLSGPALMDFYAGLIKDFPVVTIEDAFDEDDWDSWQSMTASIGVDVQVVGDDLTVTNPVKIKRAIEEKSCNALLLKLNQIGSVTEAIQAVKDAKAAGWGVMTSHRSGETEDTYIADLAVGLCTGQIKTGAPCRSERTAKYNQLLRIEEELGDVAYAGKDFRTPPWMNQ